MNSSIFKFVLLLIFGYCGIVLLAIYGMLRLFNWHPLPTFAGWIGL